MSVNKLDPNSILRKSSLVSISSYGFFFCAKSFQEHFYFSKFEASAFLIRAQFILQFYNIKLVLKKSNPFRRFYKLNPCNAALLPEQHPRFADLQQEQILIAQVSECTERLPLEL